jgi:hypothetical protein
MLLRIESHSPLHDITESDWKEVVVVLRGTLLTFYRARKDGSAGKMLRSYTLQHAEIGLASDTQYAILVPQSRIAHFLPAAAWRKAWRTDPALFKSEEQSLLRLRVETDQILVAHSEEAIIQDFTYALAAAIDIATDIDERSIPRQCTVPRRRNRPRTLEAVASILENPSILAQQERIMRELYPQLASSTSETDRSQPVQSESTEARPTSPVSAPAANEDEEIDLSAMHEEPSAESSSDSNLVEAESHFAMIDLSVSRRPSVFRQATALTIDSMDSTFSAEMFYDTPSINFGADGKWSPPHNRSPAQIQRYIQRCMPVLLADSPRASDVLIHAGRRVKINWRTAMLEDWTLLPPSYRSHRFDPIAAAASTSSATATTNVRSASRLTRTPSQTSSAAHSASEASSDEIALVNSAAAGADLTLTSTTDKSTITTTKPSPRSRKTRQGSTNSASTGTTQSSQLNLHSAIYCF